MVLKIELERDGIKAEVTIDLKHGCCSGTVEAGANSAKLDADLGRALQEAITKYLYN